MMTLFLSPVNEIVPGPGTRMALPLSVVTSNGTNGLVAKASAINFALIICRPPYRIAARRQVEVLNLDKGGNGRLPGLDSIFRIS